MFSPTTIAYIIHVIIIVITGLRPLHLLVECYNIITGGIIRQVIKGPEDIIRPVSQCFDTDIVYQIHRVHVLVYIYYINQQFINNEQKM